MRKYFLLLGEWYSQQRSTDMRCYMLMRTQMTGDRVPEAGDLFPSLGGRAAGPAPDDDTAFSAAVMAFTW